jgi:hypothetical protein
VSLLAPVVCKIGDLDCIGSEVRGPRNDGPQVPEGTPVRLQLVSMSNFDGIRATVHREFLEDVLKMELHGIFGHL